MSDTTRPPNAIELAEGVWIRPEHLTERFTRSGGPGGQAVNKLCTRAELRLSVTDIEGLDETGLDRLRRFAKRWLTNDDELVIHAETYRSQRDNRKACLEKLQQVVAEAAHRPKVRRRRRPTRAMKERRLQEKRETAEKKRRRGWSRGDSA